MWPETATPLTSWTCVSCHCLLLLFVSRGAVLDSPVCLNTGGRYFMDIVFNKQLGSDDSYSTHILIDSVRTSSSVQLKLFQSDWKFTTNLPKQQGSNHSSAGVSVLKQWMWSCCHCYSYCSDSEAIHHISNVINKKRKQDIQQSNPIWNDLLSH